MARKFSAVPTTVTGFGDYFDSHADVDAILTVLGYTYRTGRVSLPRYQEPLDFVAELERKIEGGTGRFTLTSESAKQQLFIAPLLLELTDRFELMVRIEHPVNVSPALRGSLDYLLDSGDGNLVLIEAKLGDMYRGFKRLAAELVALDQWTDSESPVLYGAVTIGNVWQFAVLDRAAKTVTQDVSLFKIPGDLEDLTRVIVGILRGLDG